MTAPLQPWANPGLAAPGTYRRVSCGCEMWIQDSDDMAVVRPCSPDCPIYHLVLHKIEERGASVEYRQDPP